MPTTTAPRTTKKMGLFLAESIYHAVGLGIGQLLAKPKEALY